jgi:signal transduction histidine kinase
LQSVRVRITAAAVVVTAVAFGIAGWLLVGSVDDEPARFLSREIEPYLDEVGDLLQMGQDPQQALESTDSPPPPGVVVVTDKSGQVVAAFPEAVRRVAEDDDEEHVALADTTDEADAPFPILPDSVSRVVETPDGALTVTAHAAVERAAESIVDSLSKGVMFGLPLLVALVGVLTWILVGRALRPVEAIRAEVERISGSTMHRRVPEPETRDEVGRLARTMNSMLARLETSVTEQRRFVSDASHELRSPVATIRAGLELARARSHQDTWPTLVDNLLDEESRLEALLDDLLLLAASDENGAGAAPAAPVNLTDLAAVEARRPRRVPVELVRAPAGDEATVVAGDRQQLARALSNLVDNAARHADSAVRISPGRDHETVRLAVDDDGPGIPPEDRERVFERFTRLDDGRARHDGGTGLGLAVARAIVTRHHGRVWGDDSPLGGARFVVELPALRIARRPRDHRGVSGPACGSPSPRSWSG